MGDLYCSWFVKSLEMLLPNLSKTSDLEVLHILARMFVCSTVLTVEMFPGCWYHLALPLHCIVFLIFPEQMPGYTDYNSGNERN